MRIDGWARPPPTHQTDRLKPLSYNRTLTPPQVLFYLPRTLRTELAMTLYEETIRKAPMFKSMPKAMVQEIAVSLHATTALPGDWIFCAGDIGHDMVFLGHGRVEVRPPQPRPVFHCPSHPPTRRRLR